MYLTEFLTGLTESVISECCTLGLVRYHHFSRHRGEENGAVGSGHWEAVITPMTSEFASVFIGHWQQSLAKKAISSSTSSP